MYSPKIDEKHIPVLYRIGRERNKPMTHLVNEAITEYLEKQEHPREAREFKLVRGGK